MSAILDRAKKYSAEIQKRSRAQQLAWFGEQLEIAPVPLLRLVGFKPKTLREKLATGVTVAELAETKPDGTLWVTEIFRELVHRNGYDIARLAKTLREPPSEAAPITPATDKSKGKPYRASNGLLSLLVRKVGAGGPQVYDDLTEYLRLSKAASGKRIKGRRLRRKSTPAAANTSSH